MSTLSANYTFGNGQYIPPVPPQVSAAMAILMATYLQVANDNGFEGVLESVMQANAANKEADKQRAQAKKTEIGDFIKGGTQIAAGSITAGSAAYAAKGLSSNSTSEIDEKLKNSKGFKDALDKTKPDASLVEKPGTSEDNELRKSAIDEMEKNFTTSSVTEDDEALMKRMTDGEQKASISKIDEEIGNLNKAKEGLNQDQEFRNKMMHVAEGVGTGIQGIGNIGDSFMKFKAGMDQADATQIRTAGSMAGSMASHFEQRSNTFLGLLNQIAQILVAISQTQVVRS